MDEIITKRHGFTPGLFILALVLVVAITGSYIVKAVFDYRSIPGNTPLELTFSAEGKVLATPDIALITFGVTTEGLDIPTITTQNTDKMNAILAMLKDTQGIDAKDITTTQYSVEPKYEYNPRTGVRTSKGYTATQQISVKVRDFTKIGGALTQATTLGANLVGNLQFTIEDLEKANQQARDKAIANAKAKAQATADAAGMKLGKIVNVQDSVYPYYGYRLDGKEALGMGGSDIAVPAPQIEPGQNEITANVSITYRVK